MFLGKYYFTDLSVNSSACSVETLILHRPSSAALLTTVNNNNNNNVQQFMYRDTTNVEHEMYDYTGNNWSHRNSNKSLKQKFGSHTRKTFNRSTTKDSYTWNITHNTESTAA